MIESPHVINDSCSPCSGSRVLCTTIRSSPFHIRSLQARPEGRDYPSGLTFEVFPEEFLVVGAFVFVEFHQFVRIEIDIADHIGFRLV